MSVVMKCKTEKAKSQREHGQPMEQTRGLFCTCNSGEAHTSASSGKISSMFEAYCTGK